MNILLAGGSCSLVDSLILKLRKEGHRVYILTGDKYRHNKYKKVFEKYEFPYDSENLGGNCAKRESGCDHSYGSI